MKYLKHTLLFMFLAVAFINCHDDDNIVTVQGTQAPVTLDINTDQITLDAIDADNPAITLTWNTAAYSQPTAVNYEVQVANDEAFTSPVTVGNVIGNNSITWTVRDLNSAVGNAGLNPLQWGTAYFRVISSIGSQGGAAQTSNAVSLNVYPYFNYPFKDYFLVGAATAPGWSNNNNNPPLFRGESNSDLYLYTGTFGAEQFKVLEVLGQWQPQWGSNDGSTLAGNPATQGDDPGTFVSPGSGYYTFVFNRGGQVEIGGQTVGPNAFAMIPFDASSHTALTSLSISGAALNGANGTMTQSTFDNSKWYINSVRLIPGEIEFIANGSASWGSSQQLGGVASPDGGMIPVPVEDDYDVWFDSLTGRYIFIPLNF